MGAKLRLDKRNAKLLGVCAGLATFTGVDVLWIRAAAIVVTLLGSGLPLLAYIVVALLAPANPTAIAD
jgi:phage shock protein C